MHAPRSLTEPKQTGNTTRRTMRACNEPRWWRRSWWPSWRRSSPGKRWPRRAGAARCGPRPPCSGQQAMSADEAAAAGRLLELTTKRSRCCRCRRRRARSATYHLDRSAHLPLPRDRSGLRHDAQGADPREVRRRHHERHRLRDVRRQGARPEGRSREGHDARQVPAVPQVVMRPGRPRAATSRKRRSRSAIRATAGTPSGHRSARSSAST